MPTFANALNQQVTQYNILAGDANNAVTNIAPSTAKFALVSNGATAQSSFQDLTGLYLQDNILYVSKSGNDSNSGENIESAFLTFNAAITASTLNDCIVCLDAGNYTENLNYGGISIYAPNATLTGSVQLGDNGVFYFYSVIYSGGNQGILISCSANPAYVNVKYLIVSSDCEALMTLNVAGVAAYFDVGEISDGGAGAIGIFINDASGVFPTYGNVKSVTVTGESLVGTTANLYLNANFLSLPYIITPTTCISGPFTIQNLQTYASSPVSSSTATTAWATSLTAGTAKQNTAGYDLFVIVSVSVTSATGATITMGVGSTSTPTTNTVIPSLTFAGATLVYTFTAKVPNNYYLLVNTTGTITVSSITTMATA